MANQRRSTRGSASASSARPASAIGSVGQLSWLKRIQQALSLANVIALATVIVALPAGFLAWRQLSDEEPIRSTPDQRAGAKSLADAALYKPQVRPSASSSGPTGATAPALTSGIVRTHVAHTVVVSPSTFDAREAELSRPNLILDSASVQDIGLGQLTKWSITMANEGRPTNVSVMNTQELSNLEAPTMTLLCPEVEKTGTTVRFGKKTGATLYGGAPLSQSDWNAYTNGTPLMLAATYCFMDEVTHKPYVKHICLKHYANGQTAGCRTNND